MLTSKHFWGPGNMSTFPLQSGPNESILGYSRKKPNRVEDRLFWKTPLKFLDLSLYP